MEGRRRVHVIVSGRVQGVFYRATCIERARALRSGRVGPQLARRAGRGGVRGPVARRRRDGGLVPGGAARALASTAVTLEEETTLGEDEFRVVA